MTVTRPEAIEIEIEERIGKDRRQPWSRPADCSRMVSCSAIDSPIEAIMIAWSAIDERREHAVIYSNAQRGGAGDRGEEDESEGSPVSQLEISDSSIR